MESNPNKSEGTVVRFQLLETEPDNLQIGKKFLIENQFEHSSLKKLEITSKDLGIIEFGKAPSVAISSILSNGNIRLGMCNIGDTSRFEIVPARGAKLELKMKGTSKQVSYIVFYNFVDKNNGKGSFEIIDYGEVI